MNKFYFLLLFAFFAKAQSKYPINYFSSPLDIPLQLSGNFGELRPNHFHAGFDFKTNQKEGLKVYAIADGYVSRIKISNSGYGKAVYISHPNGYTSVYGHLQNALGLIDTKIKEEQYVQQTYEVEIYLKPGDLIVKKGEVIALSGNTGGSEGPHLHFEIRDSVTEKIINPMHFGYSKLMPDAKKPTITTLLAYPIDENSIVNQSQRPVSLNLSLQADGTYLSEKVMGSGKIGFGVASYDQDNVSYNNNGTYKTELSGNAKTVFGIQFDEMAFDEARYINYFIDYKRYKTMRQRVQKLFSKNAYPLSTIFEKKDNGIIEISPNTNQICKLEISDFNKNKVVVTIPIEYATQKTTLVSDSKKTPFFIKYDREANFEKENVSVNFPENTFYEDFYLNFEVQDNVLTLHEDIIAVHSNFTISIEDSKSSEKEKEKMFIALMNGNKLSYNATKLNGNTFSCKTKTLGKFTLAKDTIAPKITISKSIEGKWITNQKSVVLTISDELSGIKTFNGYLNEKWVLFEYESKAKRITHVFNEEFLLDGSNNLKVVVTDNVGNSSIFETQFNSSKKK